MIKVFNYAVNKNGAIYALLQKNDKSICLAQSMTDSINSLGNWTIIQDNLDQKFNSKFNNLAVIMQADNNYIYLIDKQDTQLALTIAVTINGTITTTTLPATAVSDGITAIFQTQAFYIHALNEGNQLYLGAKNQILVLEANTNTWQTFYEEFQPNENPFIIKGNSDILAVITNQGRLYISKIGSNNFKHYQLNDATQVYALILNIYNASQIIIIYSNGIIEIFTYNVADLSINMIVSKIVPALLIDDGFEASITDYSRFGNNIFIGIVNHKEDVTQYSSIRISQKLEITPLVGGTLAIANSGDNINVLAKFRLDTLGLLIYLSNAGDLYYSGNAGDSWTKLDINLN